MGWSARIQRGFGRMALVGATITGLIVSLNLVMAAASWFFLTFSGLDLKATLEAERKETIGYQDSAYLTAAREAKIIPQRWELDPVTRAVTPPKGFELIGPANPKPWEVMAFGKLVEDDRRWHSTRNYLEIAAVVGLVGLILTAAIWVFGWVIAGFFT